VKADDVLAQTKNGKQILNVDGKDRAVAFTPAEGDHIAVIGSNRKLLIFPLEQLPEMTRARCVPAALQGWRIVGCQSLYLKAACHGNPAIGKNGTDLRAWRGDRARPASYAKRFRAQQQVQLT